MQSYDDYDFSIPVKKFRKKVNYTPEQIVKELGLMLKSEGAYSRFQYTPASIKVIWLVAMEFIKVK